MVQENQLGLKFNEKCQLLAYAENVTIGREYERHINAGSSIDASKRVV
jgi:hypothetical protein